MCDRVRGNPDENFCNHSRGGKQPPDGFRQARGGAWRRDRPQSFVARLSEESQDFRDHRGHFGRQIRRAFGNCGSARSDEVRRCGRRRSGAPFFGECRIGESGFPLRFRRCSRRRPTARHSRSHQPVCRCCGEGWRRCPGSPRCRHAEASGWGRQSLRIRFEGGSLGDGDPADFPGGLVQGGLPVRFRQLWCGHGRGVCTGSDRAPGPVGREQGAEFQDHRAGRSGRGRGVVQGIRYSRKATALETIAPRSSEIVMIQVFAPDGNPRATAFPFSRSAGIVSHFRSVRSPVSVV